MHRDDELSRPFYRVFLASLASLAFLASLASPVGSVAPLDTVLRSLSGPLHRPPSLPIVSTGLAARVRLVYSFFESQLPISSSLTALSSSLNPSTARSFFETRSSRYWYLSFFRALDDHQKRNRLAA